MDKKITNLLYRSFDGDLSAEEQQKLDNALSDSTELRKEREQVFAMRQAFSNTGEKYFKPFFAERVMNQIKSRRASCSEANSFFDSLIAVFRPVAIGAAIILVTLLSYNMKKTKNYSLAGALGKQQITLEEIVDPLYMLTME